MSEDDPAAKAAKPLGSGWGLLLGVLLHVLFFPLIDWNASQPEDTHTLSFAVPIIGLTQLVYMFPAIVLANLVRQPEVAKGITTIAFLTFMLNAGCVGLVFFIAT